MKGKDLLSVADLTSEEVWAVIQKAREMKGGGTPALLQGKTVALLFEKPSLRTRVSFEVGVRQMGGYCLYLGGGEVGLGVREPVADVARVMGRWVDVMVARVFSHRNLELLAQHADIPVVNALSDLEHPCQALGDLLTVYEKKGRLEGVTIAYVGDGNNVATSLALAAASVGANFTIASPKGYQIPTAAWSEAQRRASLKESNLTWVESPLDAAKGADVVYTDVWVSMGQEEERKKRLKEFAGYQVNEVLLGHASEDVLFMHDMPAHPGEEIAEGLLDHPRSVVFDQAENRLHIQKAILAEIMGS